MKNRQKVIETRERETEPLTVHMNKQIIRRKQETGDSKPVKQERVWWSLSLVCKKKQRKESAIVVTIIVANRDKINEQKKETLKLIWAQKQGAKRAEAVVGCGAIGWK